MEDCFKTQNVIQNVKNIIIFLGYIIVFFIFLIPILFSSMSSLGSLSFTKKQLKIEKTFNYILLTLPVLFLYVFEFNVLLISYLLSVFLFYTFHYIQHKNIDFQTTHLWLLSIIYLPLYLAIHICQLCFSLFI
jgi:hypothetical protein